MHWAFGAITLERISYQLLFPTHVYTVVSVTPGVLCYKFPLVSCSVKIREERYVNSICLTFIRYQSAGCWPVCLGDTESASHRALFFFFFLVQFYFPRKHNFLYKGIPSKLARFKTFSNNFLNFYVVNIFPLISTFKRLFGYVHPFLEYFSIFIKVPVQFIDGIVVSTLSYPGDQGHPLDDISPRYLLVLQFSSGSGCCPWALPSAPKPTCLHMRLCAHCFLIPHARLPQGPLCHLHVWLFCGPSPRATQAAPKSFLPLNPMPNFKMRPISQMLKLDPAWS